MSEISQSEVECNSVNNAKKTNNYKKKKMNQKVMPNNLGALEQEECNDSQWISKSLQSILLFSVLETFNPFAEKIAHKVNVLMCDYFTACLYM